MYGAVCLNFILQLFWFLEATFCCNFYEIFLKISQKCMNIEQSCVILLTISQVYVSVRYVNFVLMQGVIVAECRMNEVFQRHLFYIL